MIHQLIELMKTCVAASDEISSTFKLNSEDKAKIGMTLFLEASRRHAVLPSTESQDSQAGASNGNGNGTHSNVGNGFNGNGRITSKQLAYLFSLGKSRGLTQVQVKDKVKAVTGKLPDFLTKGEASDAITALQSLPEKNGR